ncbi:hypothetical protein BH23THE1_BH23THE1_30480 [soil metagenome]
MNNILIINGMALLTAICISGLISLSVMAKEKPFEPTYSCFELAVDKVKCCQAFTGDDGNLMHYCTVCDNTKPPSNCSPRSTEMSDSNNQDTTIPPTSGVDDDSNNEDTSPSIPPTSGVEDDANSGDNTSPRIPTKGDGLNTLDGDKVLSPQ